MALETTLCVLLFLIKLLCDFPTCVSSSTPDCTPMVEKPVCPHGYMETPLPRACVTSSKENLNFSMAKEYCAKLDPPYSSLWMSYDDDQSKHLKALMKLVGNATHAYIGLSDEKKEGDFIWSNGQKLRKKSKRWSRGQPNGKRLENAVVSAKSGYWKDLTSDKTYPALCMTRHQIGPREMDMTLTYHAPKRGSKIIYKGTDVIYTCTVFDRESRFWVMRAREVSFFGSELRYVSHTSGPARNSLGMCTNKLSIKMKVSLGYRFARDIKTNRTLEFYPRLLDDCDKNHPCQDNPNEFCRKFVFPMLLLDPPTEKPIMDILINRDKNTARSVCWVDVGWSGKMTWVLYFTNKTQVLQDNDPRIKGSIRAQWIKHLRWREYASLLLKYEDVKGIYIGCFDHNITEYNLTSTCETEDLFCVRKKVETWGEDSKEIPSNTGLIYIGLFILFIGGIFGTLFLLLHKWSSRQDIKNSYNKSALSEDLEELKYEQFDVTDQQEPVEEGQQPPLPSEEVDNL